MRLVLAALLTLLMGLMVFANGEQHQYAGTKKCKMCHKGEKNNFIYETWAETKHANAYAVLAADEAKHVYEGLGYTGNPQEDDKCLRCHVPGVGMDSTYTAKIVLDDGVSCEVCHGAGNDYKKKSVMEDREMAISMGLTADPKAVCISCHNEEAPTFKGFNFEESWEKIKHSLPEPVVEE
jgi:Cytochrome c554 and c-prime